MHLNSYQQTAGLTSKKGLDAETVSVFTGRYHPYKNQTKKEVQSTLNKKKVFFDDISFYGDFLSVDQMITPAHSSFENEHDYQLVLSDIFK